MFKPGTLVIGKDQSYRRSIYRVVKGINQHAMMVSLVCYAGRRGTGAYDKAHKRQVKEFRKATKKEIKKEFGETFGRDLICFVEKLLTLSYRGRRSTD